MKDSSHDVLITVSGRVATGKSSIARVIELALQHYGIKVERIDDNGMGVDEHRAGVVEPSLIKRIKFLSQRGLNVKIQTKQVKR